MFETIKKWLREEEKEEKEESLSEFLKNMNNKCVQYKISHEQEIRTRETKLIEEVKSKFMDNGIVLDFNQEDGPDYDYASDIVYSYDAILALKEVFSVSDGILRLLLLEGMLILNDEDFERIKTVIADHGFFIHKVSFFVNNDDDHYEDKTIGERVGARLMTEDEIFQRDSLKRLKALNMLE